MRNLFIFSLLLVSFLFNFAQEQQKSEIFQLIENLKKTDKKLAEKLENFAKDGIEKPLPTENTSADSLIAAAKYYLGTPHKMGGLDKNGIDCSGLLFMSFKKVGIDVPHNSEELARYGKIIINADSLKRGDLVFFVNTYKTSKVITHSGIYLGDGDFIHTSFRKGVIISNLNSPYYQQHFIFGTRIFKN